MVNRLSTCSSTKVIQAQRDLSYDSDDVSYRDICVTCPTYPNSLAKLRLCLASPVARFKRMLRSSAVRPSLASLDRHPVTRLGGERYPSRSELNSKMT